MMKFLETVKGKNANGEVESKLKEVLDSGKDEIKRQRVVDRKYYGTAEGQEAKEKMEGALREKEARKRKRKRRAARKAKGDMGSDGGSGDDDGGGKSGGAAKGPAESSGSVLDNPGTVAAVTAGVALAAVGVILGGRSR